MHFSGVTAMRVKIPSPLSAMKPSVQGLSSENRRNYHEARRLVMVGGAAVQATALSLIHQGAFKEKEQVSVISSPGWLRKCHPDWHDKPWGQSMRYLPPSMKKIAEENFPHYSDDRRMSYGMLKRVLELQENLLRSSGVEVIVDEVRVIKQEEERLMMYDANGSRCLSPNESFYIFNAARTPDLGGSLGSMKSFSDFYSRSKLNIAAGGPNVVLGSGLNLDWSVRDTNEDAPIIHLIPKGDRERPDLYSSPHFGASFSLMDEDFKLEHQADGTVIVEGFDLKTKTHIQVRVPESNLYTAKGMDLNYALVNVDPGKVTYVDASPSAKDIVSATYLSTGNERRKAIDNRGTVIPPGNLGATYHAVRASMTRLLEYPLDNPYAAVDHKKAWKNGVTNKLEAAGCHIDPHFFTQLHSILKHSFESHTHPDQMLWDVMQKTYEKGLQLGHHKHADSSVLSSPVATNTQGEALTWEQFRAVLSSSTPEETLGIVQEKPNILGMQTQAFRQKVRGLREAGDEPDRTPGMRND